MAQQVALLGHGVRPGRAGRLGGMGFGAQHMAAQGVGHLPRGVRVGADDLVGLVAFMEAGQQRRAQRHRIGVPCKTILEGLIDGATGVEPGLDQHRAVKPVGVSPSVTSLST